MTSPILSPLLVIVGPTATGKTALAVQLARHLGGEIVGADARQVYRGLDVGTGKATVAELQGVAHHLIDVVGPDQPFTVADYAALASQAIAGVLDRGHLPILTGGTGLYVRAVVDALRPPAVPPQPALRATLERRWRTEGPERLLRDLEARDPAAAATIDRRNPRRVIRALEVCLLTGRPFSEQRQLGAPPYAALRLGLTGERSALQTLADRRIDAMFAGGLVEEVRGLVAAGHDFSLPAFTAVGYREVAAYLPGRTTLEEARLAMQRASHAYQRRQLTWFRADRRVVWLEAAAADLLPEATRRVEGWLRTL